MASISEYNYLLPKNNLALEPVVPRDSSKLFIYIIKIDQIIFDYFYNLDKYLPKNSFMVLNNTKVLPARVVMKKQSGGKVVILLLINEIVGNMFPIIVDRRITVGEKIYFNENDYLDVIHQKENIFEVRFNFSKEYLFDLLRKYGAMPIPPYLKKSTLTRDELLEKYQTIIAKTDGSAAAPTASLHFTDSVFNKLSKKGIERLFVTLHVGMGTFAPINEENVKKKKLHNEFYEIDRNTWKQIEINRNKEKKLVAVGTTVVRTLESIAKKLKIKNEELRIFEGREKRNFFTFERGPKGERLSCDKNYVSEPNKILGKTDLFIFPPYDFRIVDVMITNFHLPKSSLMMLVEAFLQHKKAKRHLEDLYNIAIKNNFRFYSFGDAMVII